MNTTLPLSQSEVHAQNSLFVCLFVCLFAHAGSIWTDRSLLTGHDALLLRQIARDILLALSHRHDYTAWPLLNQSIAMAGVSQ